MDTNKLARLIKAWTRCDDGHAWSLAVIMMRFSCGEITDEEILLIESW